MLRTPEQQQLLVTGLENAYDRYSLQYNNSWPDVFDAPTSITDPNQKFDDEPALTVAVPVSVLNEDLDRLEHTVKLIDREAASLEGPVEVLVWTNARKSRLDDSTIAQAEDRHEMIREQLKPLASDQLRIVSALALRQAFTTSMAQVRADMMHTVAEDAIEREIGYDMPVLWLDADTTAIRPGSLARMADYVRRLDSYFVHANTDYSIDWETGSNLTEYDSASRAVAVTELIRRRISRAGGQPSYHEESGLAFAIGTYLDSGGVSPRIRNSESDHIITAGQNGLIRPDKAMLQAISGYSEMNPSVRYLPGTRVSTSARRHYAALNETGVEALRDPDHFDYSGTFASLPPEQLKRIMSGEMVVDAKDMHWLVDSRLRMATRAYGLLHYDADRIKGPLHALVDRYFSDGPDEPTPTS